MPRQHLPGGGTEAGSTAELCSTPVEPVQLMMGPWFALLSVGQGTHGSVLAQASALSRRKVLAAIVG